jgi:hypothetical protein
MTLGASLARFYDARGVIVATGLQQQHANLWVFSQSARYN